MIKTLFVLNGGEADWIFIVGETYLGHKVIKINDLTYEFNQHEIITDKGSILVSSNNVIAFHEQQK